MSREQNNLLFITALTRHHRRAQHKMARSRLNFRSSSRLSELLYSFSRLVRASPNFSHAIVKGMGWCTRKLIHFCERKLNLMSANPFLLLRFNIFLVWRVVEFFAARGFASRRFDECPKTERLADFLRIFSVGCKKISDSSMIQRACSRSVLSPTCSVSLCSVLRRKGACSLTRSLRSPAHDMCRDVVIVNGSRRAGEARQGGKPYVRE